jgi:hypothetical protein
MSGDDTMNSTTTTTAETDTIERLQKRIRFLEEVNAAQQQLLEGTYYSCFSQVWSPEPVAYNAIENDYVVHMTRGEAPSLRNSSNGSSSNSNNNTARSPYQMTLEKAEDKTTMAKDDDTCSRGSHNSKKSKDEGWRVDILGQKKADDAHIAHLVPASSKDASFYYHVAQWVFGITANDNTEGHELVKKLIHGACQVGVNDNRKGKRINGTGLKHFAYNKICVRGQSTYFDGKPCLLIVPILNLNNAKEWNGKGYEAVVMIDKKDNQLQHVAQGVGMLSIGNEAEQSDIDIALGLLRTTLLALAQSLFRLNTSLKAFLPEASHALVNEYWDAIFQLDGSATVFLPKKNEFEPRVRKITFSDAVNDNDNLGRHHHPAPDPILLAVKAGVVWSKFHNQQLLAGGEVSDDNDMDSLDLLAEEEFLEFRDSMQRCMAIPGEISIPMSMGSSTSSSGGGGGGDGDDANSGKISPLPEGLLLV